MLVSSLGYWQSCGLCLKGYIPSAVSKSWTMVVRSPKARARAGKMGCHWKIPWTSDTFGRERNPTGSLRSSNLKSFDRERVWVQSFVTNHWMDPKIRKQLQSQSQRKDEMSHFIRTGTRTRWGIMVPICSEVGFSQWNFEPEIERKIKTNKQNPNLQPIPW